jgi:hypothetical protein
VAESKPLESIVNRLIGEKAKVEAELQEARQTIHRLEASLAASRPRKDADPKPPTVASGTTDSNEASPREASEGSLDDIKARYAEALFEKESARQEIDSLEKQVADFRALVEEFLAQGALLESEHTAALHSEMEMVREQAGSELMALQAMLQEAEAENARLRACVEAAPKPSTALTESAAELALPHEDLSEETATTQPKALSAIVTPVALAIVLSALILGGLFGLPAGRDLVRSWVGAETSAAGPSGN